VNNAQVARLLRVLLRRQPHASRFIRFMLRIFVDEFALGPWLFEARAP